MLYNNEAKELIKEMVKEYGKKARLLDVVEEFKKRAKEKQLA